MSLGPTFVQATDHQMYKDPIIWEPGWFICFDEDDPPEIILTRNNVETADQILARIGIEYTNLQPHQKNGSRSFPPKWKLQDAISYFFELTAPIPIPRGQLPTQPHNVRHGTFIEFDPSWRINVQRP